MELKPCPFCGGEAHISHYMDENIWDHSTVPWYRVGCDACEIYVHSYPDEDEVIDKWNSRVGEQ